MGWWAAQTYRKLARGEQKMSKQAEQVEKEQNGAGTSRTVINRRMRPATGLNNLKRPDIECKLGKSSQTFCRLSHGIRFTVQFYVVLDCGDNSKVTFHTNVKVS